MSFKFRAEGRKSPGQADFAERAKPTAVVLAAWLVLSLALGGCGQSPAVSVDDFGIRIDGIHLSAGGYMLDFRYQVTDVKKAKPVLARGANPYLVDLATGARFSVPNAPKVGSLRQTTRGPELNRRYWVMFANPGRYVKKGSQVSVVIGDFRSPPLVVM